MGLKKHGLSYLTAVLIGLIGSCIVWVVTPYNNFVLAAGFISDSYLPVAALFLFLVLVLLINPVLRRFTPRLVLSRGQLIVILGILLVASVLPGQGLHRILPHAIAYTNLEVSRSPELVALYEEAGIRQWLFPAALEYDYHAPVVEYFVTELPPDEPIPWMAWISGPVPAWMLLMLALWLMMAGLALVVLPQWRENERLSFPLLTVMEPMVDRPQGDRLFPELFYSKMFWIAAGVVFVLHLLMGLNSYYPERIPAIPLSWNLQNLFADDPLRSLPGHIHTNQIYFLFLGVAFFMPARIGFSIWFFVLAYGVYVMIGNAYLPIFSTETVRDHRWGAMVVLTIAIIWLGRLHWARVARCMVRAANVAADRRDRIAGWTFVAGCFAIFLWLVIVGRVQFWWALFLLGYAVSCALLISRIVAETGVPFLRLDTGGQVPFLKIIGTHLAELKMLWFLSPATLFFSTIITVLVEQASRVSPSVMLLHAHALGEKLGPRRQGKLATTLILVLLIGFVVCGAAHLYYGYNHGGSLDGLERPLSEWGSQRFNPANTDLRRYSDGHFALPYFQNPDRWHLGFGHAAFGAVLAGVLYWLCLKSPVWPLHPVGILMAGTFFGNQAWVSIFFGWLFKVLLLRYGGALVYRSVKPLVLGLILGEVIAIAFWAIEPVVRIWLGDIYIPLEIQPR